MNEDPEIPTWIMTLIALGFFGGLAAFVFWLRERRRAGFEKLARRHGMEYYEDGARAVTPPDDFVAEVVRGLVVDTRIGQALVGEVEGVSIAVCEVVRLRANSGPGERAHYSWCVAFVTLSGSELPAFAIDPRTLRHRLLKRHRSGAIEFDEPPEFSRRYVVTGTDAGAIQTTLLPPVREFLARRPGRRVRCFGNELAWFRPARMLRWSAFRPAPVERLLGESKEFVRLLRESV